MIICPSIAPKTIDEAVVKLQSFSSDELVEVRVDGIPGLNLRKLLRQPRPKVIITNRKKDEGGKFIGSITEQSEILANAIEYGAEYIDVEYSWGKDFIASIQSKAGQTKVICSYHNFENTPDNLIKMYNSLRKTHVEIIKIATMANDITDNKKIFNLLQRAKADRQNIIALCMGEYGEISRTLSGIHGGYLSFASLTSREVTADGQITTEDMKTIFRADRLDCKTKIFGLLGNPVKHSQGIYFHNERFALNRLNAVYVNFLVTNLKSFLGSYRDDITGLSVTMPFKQEIVKYIDTLDRNISDLKIVNTVIKKKKKLIGYNTDLTAISTILKKYINVKKKNVVVLGTGSIARTMAYASITNKANTTIVGRNRNKAKSLADEFGCQWTTLDNLTSVNTDVLMNGTLVGMKGTKKIRLVPLKFFKKEMIVFDAIYNPTMTTLLHDAVQAGCRIINGLELFNRQAEIQSKLFMDCCR